MVDSPILFSPAMVRALLYDRKTQTRRALSPQPYDFMTDGRRYWNASGCVGGRICISDRDLLDLHHKPAPGDRLYVREAYYQRGHWEPILKLRGDSSKEKWLFVPQGEPTFEAPAEFRLARHRKDSWTVAWHKRLGRFMPRACSRLTLIVTDVRVERLQDISEADAIAEGIRVDSIPDGLIPGGNTGYGFDGHSGFPTATSAYAVLWDHINGAGAWDANPWVVAITFTVHHHNIDHNIDEVPHV